MPLHFIADEATDAGVGDEVRLLGAEAHHAAAVRRVRVGEAVTVGDGRGVWLDGQCAGVAPREVVVRVTARTVTAAPAPRIVLVQALAKAGRDEAAVQAACELGVDEVVPWQADRSVSRWDGAKRERGRARWQTIVREAAKQAHRRWVPAVEPVTGIADLVRRAAASRTLVLDPYAPHPLSAQALDPTDPRDVVLVVGPEGGIAEAELAALDAAGATGVRLGAAVLRTSTAGPAALAVVNVLLGRF